MKSTLNRQLIVATGALVLTATVVGIVSANYRAKTRSDDLAKSLPVTEGKDRLKNQSLDHPDFSDTLHKPSAPGDYFNKLILSNDPHQSSFGSDQLGEFKLGGGGQLRD
jgi:hypothetical protein